MFILPSLRYNYNALEPFIDAVTMEIHHNKHHQAYINNLNQTLENFPELQKRTLEDLIINLKNLPSEAQSSVQNNGGGHYNHSLFWEIISPVGRKEASQDLTEAINSSFENFENFKQQFEKQALSRFGSGWVWLIKNKNNQLEILSTPNQDTPLEQGVPILGLDVWEHAYYLNYQNRRADYIKSFWEIINWSNVSKKYSL